VPANVVRAVEAVRAAGLPTFNLDIIYGGAGETLDDWRSTLEGVLALSPPHVSAYALTIEAGTPLAEDSSRHPDDDDLADKYELADDLLTAAGLTNYEVSNWALPGHECRHNILYWRQGNYRGFGSAAHSHHDGHDGGTCARPSDTSLLCVPRSRRRQRARRSTTRPDVSKVCNWRCACATECLRRHSMSTISMALSTATDNAFD
jgi:coproporphyrinogen III oxidase-like Fe-S oxidoreductase